MNCACRCARWYYHIWARIVMSRGLYVVRLDMWVGLMQVSIGRVRGGGTGGGRSSTHGSSRRTCRGGGGGGLERGVTISIAGRYACHTCADLAAFRDLVPELAKIMRCIVIRLQCWMIRQRWTAEKCKSLHQLSVLGIAWHNRGHWWNYSTHCTYIIYII